MINKVILVGRITKDLELKKTNSNLSTCHFNLACDRKMKKNEADFVPCTAWRQSAEYLCQYAKKGDVVSIEGHITTGSYENKGVKVYTTDVTCESVKIISSKNPPEQKELNEEYKPDTNVIYPDEVDTNDLPWY